jgi:E3 ubiquitin-protein ligase UBR4
MLARFATGASFSADCRGGGKESNSRFLPFMIQLARHFLDHDPSQRLAMAKCISTYLASPTLESKPTSPFGTQPSDGTEETVQFMMVSSLLSESYEAWLQHRRAFLQRGIYHAYMQRSRGRSMNRSSPTSTSTMRTDLSTSSGQLGETGGSDELFSTIQPMLVYTGLIEQLQQFFKVKKSSTVTADGTVVSEDENKGLEVWELFMKERLLNVKDMVGFSKELLSWLEDMTSATDLQEAFDIIGMLADVLTGGYTQCEEFVNAAINSGRS